MKKELKKTYHLYQHQPEPLAPVDTSAWLLGNGASYRKIASIQAHTVEEAYQAMQEKEASRGRLKQFVTLLTQPSRETLPGDVLLGEHMVWMVVPGGQLERISYETERAYRSYRHDAVIKSLDWAPDGKYVVALSDVITLHGVYAEQSASYYRHERQMGSAVAWSPDGALIASGGNTCEVHIWAPDPADRYRDAAVGSILICRLGEKERWYTRISSLAWTPDAESVLAGRNNGEVIQWDAETGACLDRFRRHTDRVTALTFSPQGTRLASASDDGTLRLWTLGHPPTEDIVCRQSGRVLACAWSPDGVYLASAAEDEPVLHLWDTFAGECMERLPLSRFSINPLEVFALSWSPDGRFLAAGGSDGVIQIVDVRLQQHVRTYRTILQHREIRALSWSPDGRFLAAGGETDWRSQGQLDIWQFAKKDEDR